MEEKTYIVPEKHRRKDGTTFQDITVLENNVKYTFKWVQIEPDKHTLLVDSNNKVVYESIDMSVQSAQLYLNGYVRGKQFEHSSAYSIGYNDGRVYAWSRLFQLLDFSASFMKEVYLAMRNYENQKAESDAETIANIVQGKRENLMNTGKNNGEEKKGIEIKESNNSD